MKIVLASNNSGKLAELQAMLQPLGMELVRQSDLGIGEAEEPYRTFVENALTKARHASTLSGLPALADDAGLCVQAFGGLRRRHGLLRHAIWLCQRRRQQCAGLA